MVVGALSVRGRVVRSFDEMCVDVVVVVGVTVDVNTVTVECICSGERPAIGISTIYPTSPNMLLHFLTFDSCDLTLDGAGSTGHVRNVRLSIVSFVRYTVVLYTVHKQPFLNPLRVLSCCLACGLYHQQSSAD